MPRKIEFQYLSTYQGQADYLVYVRGGAESYRISATHAPPPWGADQYNGTAEQFSRDVLGQIGTLVRRDGEPIDADVVDAFNGWQRASHVEWKSKILAAPERYGISDANDPYFVEPLVYVGAYWDNGLVRQQHRDNQMAA